MPNGSPMPLIFSSPEATSSISVLISLKFVPAFAVFIINVDSPTSPTSSAAFSAEYPALINLSYALSCVSISFFCFSKLILAPTASDSTCAILSVSINSFHFLRSTLPVAIPAAINESPAKVAADAASTFAALSILYALDCCCKARVISFIFPRAVDFAAPPVSAPPVILPASLFTKSITA